MLQLTGVAEQPGTDATCPNHFFFGNSCAFYWFTLRFSLIEWQIERKTFLNSLLQPNFNNFRHACSQVWVTYSRQHLRWTNIPKHIVAVEVDKKLCHLLFLCRTVKQRKSKILISFSLICTRQCLVYHEYLIIKILILINPSFIFNVGF